MWKKNETCDTVPLTAAGLLIILCSIIRKSPDLVPACPSPSHTPAAGVCLCTVQSRTLIFVYFYRLGSISCLRVFYLNATWVVRAINSLSLRLAGEVRFLSLSCCKLWVNCLVLMWYLACIHHEIKLFCKQINASYLLCIYWIGFLLFIVQSSEVWVDLILRRCQAVNKHEGLENIVELLFIVNIVKKHEAVLCLNVKNEVLNAALTCWEVLLWWRRAQRVH